MGAVMSPSRGLGVTSVRDSLLVEQPEWEYSPRLPGYELPSRPLEDEPKFSWSQEAVETAEDDDILQRLIQRWVRAAVGHHVVRSISDPDGYVATVAGIDGAWGFGDSPEEARSELESVLFGWVSLKLEDGDDDIPNMEGVYLVVRR